MAPRRKPRKLKVLAGTLRKHRDLPDVELPAITSAKPPDWLTDADALAAWELLVALLCRARVLTELDLSALGHLCNLHADILKAHRAGAETSAALLAQLRLWAIDFGLTPASRGRARRAADPPEPNPFAHLDGPSSGRRSIQGLPPPEPRTPNVWRRRKSHYVEQKGKGLAYAGQALLPLPRKPHSHSIIHGSQPPPPPSG
jgi:phage terminase small subunit